MCGISGIYNLTGDPVDGHVLRKMNRTMIHRGPDGEGYYLNHSGNGEKSHIGLGHRRLSIIDLDSGDQPMSGCDGSITVVFNGEIYNYLELRKELESKGHRFRTKSDTESIIYAYAQWGTGFVKKLRGMFAIALWDSRKERLVLARDRVGKKPLYYYYDEKKIVFASELKALLKFPGLPMDMDYHGLDAYFSFGYVPSPLSIFKAVKKLEPAHIAVCSTQGFHIESYWDLDMNSFDPAISETRAMDELLSLFDESVKIRLASDVPLGAFLSGGVDSSAVVASMANLMKGNPVKTSSIGFSEKRFDELEYARIVSQIYKTDHQEAVIDPDALEVIEKIAWHFDEPFADASAIPTWYVSMITRQNVTVALSGDGGDETFAGYVQRYSMNRLENGIRQKIPHFLQNTLIKQMANYYPRIDTLPRPLRLKLFLTNLSLSMEQAYYRDMSFYFSEQEKGCLYRPELKRKVADYSSFSVLDRFFKRNKNPDSVTRAQYVDIKTYMTEDILVKVDRMSMAHSLEVRSPILDHKLMEFAARLPSSLKLNKNESKYILKRINEKRLPPDILYRKKQGFCVPLADWFRGELKTFVNEILFGPSSRLKNLIDDQYAGKLWDNHLRGSSDNSSQIWNLLMFELWQRQFL